jgi:hypothetical protein
MQRNEAGERTRRPHLFAVAALFVVVLLLTETLLSMWRPATYPRLRVLPAPAFSQFEDECGRGVLRGWKAGTLFWEHEDFVDTASCVRT